MAGAEGVVASLWQVPDTEMAELIDALLANLAAGRSKTDALRNAQLAVIAAHRTADGSQPFSWAALTLTGR